jgi:hypothetical protein
MLYDKSFNQLRRFAADLPEMHPEPFPAQGDQDPIRANLDELKKANDALNSIPALFDAKDRGGMAQALSVAYGILMPLAQEAPELEEISSWVAQSNIANQIKNDGSWMAWVEAAVMDLEQLIQEYEDAAADEFEEEDPEEVEVDEIDEEPQPDGPDEILMTNDNMHDIADAYADMPPPPRKASIEAQLDAAYRRIAQPMQEESSDKITTPEQLRDLWLQQHPESSAEEFEALLAEAMEMQKHNASHKRNAVDVEDFLKWLHALAIAGVIGNFAYDVYQHRNDPPQPTFMDSLVNLVNMPDNPIPASPKQNVKPKTR